MYFGPAVQLADILLSPSAELCLRSIVHTVGYLLLLLLLLLYYYWLPVRRRIEFKLALLI